MKSNDEIIDSPKNFETAETTLGIFSLEDLRAKERAFEEKMLRDSDPVFLDKIHTIRQRIKRLQSVKSYVDFFRKECAKYELPHPDLVDQVEQGDELLGTDIFELRKRYEEFVNQDKALDKEGDEINAKIVSLLEHRNASVCEIIEGMSPVMLDFSARQQLFNLEFTSFRQRYEKGRSNYVRSITDSLELENLDQIYLRRQEISRNISRQRNASFGLGRFVNRQQIKDLTAENDKLRQAEKDIHDVNNVGDLSILYLHDDDHLSLIESYRRIITAVNKEVSNINGKVFDIRNSVLEYSLKVEPVNFKDIPESILRSIVESNLNYEIYETDKQKKEQKITEITDLILKKLKSLRSGEKIENIDIADDEYQSAIGRVFYRLESFLHATNQFTKFVAEASRLGPIQSIIEDVKSFNQEIAGYKPYGLDSVLNKGDYIKGNNISWWKYFREFLRTRNGEEMTSYIDRKVGSLVCSSVERLARYENRDERIKFGYSLFDFNQTEFIPTAILNAYLEPGSSGEMPFIREGGFGRLSDQAILVKYVRNLPAEAVTALEETDPEISEIIREISSFAGEALESRMEADDSGKYIEISGSYHRVRQLKNKYTLRRLEMNDRPEARAFLTNCFAFDKSTPELTDRMIALFDSLPSRECWQMIDRWPIRDLSVDQQRALLTEIKNVEKESSYVRNDYESYLLKHLAYGLTDFDPSLIDEAIEILVKEECLGVFHVLFNGNNIQNIRNLNTEKVKLLIRSYMSVMDFDHIFDLEKLMEYFSAECQPVILECQQNVLDESIEIAVRDRSAKILKGIRDINKTGTLEIQRLLSNYCLTQLVPVIPDERILFLIKFFAIDRDNPELIYKLLAMYENFPVNAKQYLIIYFKENISALAEIKLDEPTRYFLVRSFMDFIQNEGDYNSIMNTYPEEFTAIVSKCKKTILDESLTVRDRDEDIALLSRVARYDESLEEHYINILTESNENNFGDSLSTEQKMAVYVLRRLDNPDSNETLFNLIINPKISKAVKYLISRTLFDNKRNFLDAESKHTISVWIKGSGKKSEIPWTDLDFLGAIRNGIPSAETQKASIDLFVRNLMTESNLEGSLHDLWRESYQSIPLKAFAQVYAWCNGNPEYLSVFNGIFDLIKKEGTMKDDLLVAVVNTCNLDLPQAGVLMAKIMMREFKTKEDVESFTALLTKIKFINTVYVLFHDDTSVYQDLSNILELIPDIYDFFELKSVIDEALRSGLDIIFNGRVEWKTIEAIQEQWNSAEPIFHYLGRYPDLRNYIAEMVNVFVSETEWNKWRYDMNNPDVVDQLGDLSAEQVRVWQCNTVADLGSIEFASFSVSDKPRQIALTMREAVVNHQHIAGNVGEGGKSFFFIQKSLASLYGQSANEILPMELTNSLMEKVMSDENRLSAIMQAEFIPRLKNTLDVVFPADCDIVPNKKVSDSLSFLGQFLPDDIAEMKKKYAIVKKQERFSVNDLITSEIRQKLEKQAIDIAKISEETKKDSSFLEGLDLRPEDLNQQKKLQLLKREMRVTCDLLRLSKVTPADLLQNRFLQSPVGGEETITGLVESLQKFFDGNPFANDLVNIYSVIKGKEEQSTQKHLGAIFTDDPCILWQVGYYPRNSGSCQNYVNGSHAGNLMGYVGDANTKVLYLFDIDRLSRDKKKRVLERGLAEALPELSKDDILVASVARAMIKIVSADGQNAILIEPTYTSQNKGDKSMDNLIDLFVKTRLGETTSLKVARSGNDLAFIKGKSRSPGGQYEDVSKIRFLA